jgi:hypothetical protein
MHLNFQETSILVLRQANLAGTFHYDRPLEVVHFEEQLCPFIGQSY